MSFNWTTERIEQLRRLHDEGLSYTEIAKVIGNGLTRNGAIGKAKRLGGLQRRTVTDGMLRAYERRRQGLKPLPRPPRVYPKRERLDIPRPPKVSRPRVVVPKEEPASLRVAFLDRHRLQCSWIASDPRVDSSCCGHRVQLGSSFCIFHHARTWMKPEYRIR